MHRTESAHAPTRSTGWTAAHWLHLAFALAATVLYVIGGIAQSDLTTLPTGVDPHRFDYPVELGSWRIDSPAELVARVGSAPADEPLRFRPSDAEFEFDIIPMRGLDPLHNLVTKLNGFFFLAVTLIVFAPRIDKVPARDLFWACLLYGLAVMIGGVYAPHGDVWPAAVLPLLRIVSLVILPTLMLHVGLTFPRRRTILDRARWLMPTITVLGLLLAVWHFVVWLRWLEGDGSWAAISVPRRLNGLFLAVVFGAGCIGLVRGFRTSVSETEREQVKWVLWGIAMGAAPYVFLHALPNALDLPLVLPLPVARIFSIVIPVAFSLAVIRHRFLDVDIIIRRSLIYILLASMMVGIYVVLGILLGRRVVEAFPAIEPAVPITATLISALLFTPTRRVIASAIDRLFFNIRFSHNQALPVFLREIRGASDQQQVADILVRFLDHHLALERIGAVLVHGDQRYAAGDWPRELSGNLELPTASGVVALPDTTSRSSIESVRFPEGLSRDGFVIARNLVIEGNAVGMLSLGPKKTQRRYVAEDLDLLEAVARETAMRVHRMNLEQDFVEERLARNQMEEMSRFRTQFFAQFAHDLRSPLTSINWGARNLLDGVVGPVTTDQAVYLEGIETSARQLVRLVNNLLEATRLEAGAAEVEFGPIDFVAVVEESVSKLRVTARSRDISIDLRVADSAVVRGHAEKLLEIVDNLVENALRYSPDGARVSVELDAVEGSARLRVSDQGPGIAPDQRETIFEAYRQGTPSPHSSQHGFGLGLFVVKSWVEKMKGSVHVEDSADGGACFVVDLPMNADGAGGGSER